MTRDQAITAITNALGQPSDGTQLAEQQAFAQRITTALDAIGLLAVAADPQATQSPAQQDPTRERQRHEHDEPKRQR